MADHNVAAAQATDAAPPAAEIGAARPERVAWTVLLVAFACFCMLTIGIAAGVYQFLFQSAVALPASLEVAVGTVGITGADLIEAVERDQRALNAETSISTDALSQATIQFHNLPDDAAQPALLAAVTLQGNTVLTFAYANSPRFDWSQLPQRIQFTSLRGTLDILVTGDGEHSLQMDIYSDEPSGGGVHVQLLAKGRYRLSASEDEVRLFSLSGRGTARFLDEPGSLRSARSGQELVLRLGSRDIIQQDRLINALQNPTFSLFEPAATGADSSIAPPGWQCAVPPDQSPQGSYSLVEFEGRRSMRLRRVNNARSNGEVRCMQIFQGGLDVRGYDTMRVLTTFSPENQSLSVCGSLASECILMLRIDYQDQNGNHGAWLRGFYYAEDVTGAARRTCASCIQDHIHTRQAVWHTFDSDNLLNLIAEEVRPQRIDSVAFYASGHQFDVVVGEVVLLVGNATVNGGNGG
ncbi:MAG: hypothetical protein F4Y70_05045 [Chloroflexi bacterium]|nr:hypothetical protein [Chloroflexota bacterium]